ncbi:MAG: Gfo/Idh/MocA family oxidoreductase [Actinomycetota bacterium]|nr:Gfo/Idh/MocA family oxidoreductase [Actinomycetota bacterium]
MSRAARPLRLGVAGLGGMGTIHAQNARHLSGAKLVAVASTRADRATAVAKQFGVRPCSYQALFAADDVDAVVVAARSVDHAALAVEVVEAGKHLFLEKPGATTLTGHEQLRRAAAEGSGQVVHVGYMRRFDRDFVAAAERVHRGDAGKPLVVLLTSRDTEWPEGEDPADTGGFLLDMASHDYDTACWLLGDEPAEVSAVRQALVYPHLANAGDLDNALVTIRFAGGAVAVTHVSRTSPFGHDIRCEIVGTEGSVFVRGPGDGAAVFVGRADAARFPADYAARFADAYRRELQAFVDACHGERSAAASLDEDRRAVAIGVAARTSAVAGRPLAVGTDWPWP